MHSFEKARLTAIETVVSEVRRKTRPSVKVAVSAKSALQHEAVGVRRPRVVDSQQWRELPEFVEVQSSFGRLVDQMGQKRLGWALVGTRTRSGGIAASIARGFWVVGNGSDEMSDSGRESKITPTQILTR
jgi:hypothetical protein